MSASQLCSDCERELLRRLLGDSGNATYVVGCTCNLVWIKAFHNGISPTYINPPHHHKTMESVPITHVIKRYCWIDDETLGVGCGGRQAR